MFNFLLGVIATLNFIVWITLIQASQGNLVAVALMNFFCQMVGIEAPKFF